MATGNTLTPPTATNPVGGTHTVTATVLDQTGAPIAGATVTFTVLSGPNVGTTGTGTSPTNSAGQAAFTYSDKGGAGTGTIQAKFTGTSGLVHESNTVTKIWQTTTHGVLEFPLGALLMLGLFLRVLLVLRRRIITGLPT